MRRSLVRFRVEPLIFADVVAISGASATFPAAQIGPFADAEDEEHSSYRTVVVDVQGTHSRPLRGLQYKPARSDGSMARHESKQHTHLRRVRRSAVYRQYYRRVSRSSAMHCGCKWCRPGLAIAYVAILKSPRETSGFRLRSRLHALHDCADA